MKLYNLFKINVNKFRKICYKHTIELYITLYRFYFKKIVLYLPRKGIQEKINNK